MQRYTFKKEERLCRKVLIEKLFSEGSSFILYPYRVVFKTCTKNSLPINETDYPPAQILISVPKRRFKTAVSRNVLKRRIRESYRLLKGETLYPTILQKELFLTFAIQYVGKTIEPYAFMEQRMRGLLNKLKEEMAMKLRKDEACSDHN